MPDVVLMDEEGVRRALDRMAFEMLERFRGTQGLGFIGIRTRGEFLARRFQAALERLEGTVVPAGALDITVYRDDFDALQERIRVAGSQIDFEVRGRHIILVDDVLYTGRSVRAAIDAIMDLGRPNSLALAVLVDRGHRELPITADFVGRTVATARNEEIQVQLREVDGADRVLLLKP
ncbi:MAG TPA: bifunctional pyr operon transcriptional regulator/uracil phosphoribosyltransferase PyrR [Candidatus Methylomirabilis sp.]|jgi:pyrimidine operon attenuation protein/uracil phosphoribosyltransferase